MTKAFISGCAGPVLTEAERAFFRAEDPWGLILFGRNCETPDQISRLSAEFRAAVGRADAPVVIDQEGGRVMRLKPPLWPSYPSGRIYGLLYEQDSAAGLRAAWLGARLIADDLLAIGITMDCLPVLDLLYPETVAAIGNRSYGRDPAMVAALGMAAAEGLLAGGVLPVMKHMPGHGRAEVDSHHDLPRIRAPREAILADDVAPFHAFRAAPFGMTAHLLYEAIDPAAPATQSKIVVDEIIRGAIGFDGALMSDDLSMQALGGTLGDRARKAHAAGLDLVLHCNGDMNEMRQVADATPELAGVALARCQRGMARRQDPAAGFDRAAHRAEFEALIGRIEPLA
ncbi:beta-N-acetylhexosaminidase [Pannonibacter tanglangensis]|uniref:beta-N-acetylhexosaminidase n=1 Tax=Pannonibacter tanglangensis TaxID=2750084 RepID=A0ABW9ZDY3_9HYPH|nr:beta-N-acetylhexosaminidase [Pannonibacter sp. XCT-34]NBN62227.1 beta-N-acetylhexosaminidase [Pannonibacter sp. XCT-34]